MSLCYRVLDIERRVPFEDVHPTWADWRDRWIEEMVLAKHDAPRLGKLTDQLFGAFTESCIAAMWPDGRSGFAKIRSLCGKAQTATTATAAEQYLRQAVGAFERKLPVKHPSTGNGARGMPIILEFGDDGPEFQVREKCWALDIRMVWCRAEIVGERTVPIGRAAVREYRVHYIGWKKVWDEWIARDSGRLVPDTPSASRGAAVKMLPVAHEEPQPSEESEAEADAPGPSVQAKSFTAKKAGVGALCSTPLIPAPFAAAAEATYASMNSGGILPRETLYSNDSEGASIERYQPTGLDGSSVRANLDGSPFLSEFAATPSLTQELAAQREAPDELSISPKRPKLAVGVETKVPTAPAPAAPPPPPATSEHAHMIAPLTPLPPPPGPLAAPTPAATMPMLEPLAPPDESFSTSYLEATRFRPAVGDRVYVRHERGKWRLETVVEVDYPSNKLKISQPLTTRDAAGNSFREEWFDLDSDHIYEYLSGAPTYPPSNSHNSNSNSACTWKDMTAERGVVGSVAAAMASGTACKLDSTSIRPNPNEGMFAIHLGMAAIGNAAVTPVPYPVPEKATFQTHEFQTVGDGWMGMGGMSAAIPSSSATGDGASNPAGYFAPGWNQPGYPHGWYMPQVPPRSKGTTLGADASPEQSGGDSSGLHLDSCGLAANATRPVSAERHDDDLGRVPTEPTAAAPEVARAPAAAVGADIGDPLSPDDGFGGTSAVEPKLPVSTKLSELPLQQAHGLIMQLQLFRDELKVLIGKKDQLPFDAKHFFVRLNMSSTGPKKTMRYVGGQIDSTSGELIDVAGIRITKMDANGHVANVSSQRTYVQHVSNSVLTPDETAEAQQKMRDGLLADLELGIVGRMIKRKEEALQTKQPAAPASTPANAAPAAPAAQAAVPGPAPEVALGSTSSSIPAPVPMQAPWPSAGISPSMMPPPLYSSLGYAGYSGYPGVPPGCPMPAPGAYTAPGAVPMPGSIPIPDAVPPAGAPPGPSSYAPAPAPLPPGAAPTANPFQVAGYGSPALYPTHYPPLFPQACPYGYPYPYTSYPYGAHPSHFVPTGATGVAPPGMIPTQDEVGIASERAAPADTPSVPTAHAAEPVVAELDESKPAESLSPVAIPPVATGPEGQQVAEEGVAAASSLEPSS